MLPQGQHWVESAISAVSAFCLSRGQGSVPGLHLFELGVRPLRGPVGSVSQANLRRGLGHGLTCVDMERCHGSQPMDDAGSQRGASNNDNART